MRRRILTAMVAVTAVAVLLFAVPLGVAASRLFRSREVTRLEREATRAAGALPATGLRGPDVVELPKGPGGVVLALYDTAGRLATGSGPARGGDAVAGAVAGRVTAHRDGAWLAVAVPVHDDEQVVGAARAAVPWEAVAARTRAAWLAMLGLGVLAVAVAAGLAWWQARTLVAPVDELAAAAVRLGDGDFAIRLPGGRTPEADRAAAALNRTAGRLGDLVARERAFSADASHQLATPLTSLRLGLESALLTPGADHRAAVADALDEVDRLQRSVATLLALARDEVSAQASCDVARTCAEAADRCRGPLAAAGRPLRVDVEAGLPPARCSPDALHEVLHVLVDNATRHGGGEVRLRARGAGRGVVIEVEDEGPGVDGDAAAIFERRSSPSGGLGIGLALARALAEAHGGRLQLRRAGPRPVFALALAGVPGDEAPAPRL
ncbi:MAG: HAMP domain-containing histidine kinase [Actinobacteria bacterium]|nr:HAMP domain-containing histidine kinase [Actinomycetota bacterium]